MKKVFLILLAALLCISAGAQDLTPKQNMRGKWGYVDSKGTMLIKAKYDMAEEFAADGLAKVKKDGKWGFINKAGKEVIRLRYDEVGYFSDGLSYVKNEGKWGIINREGKVLVKV